MKEAKEGKNIKAALCCCVWTPSGFRGRKQREQDEWMHFSLEEASVT